MRLGKVSGSISSYYRRASRSTLYNCTQPRFARKQLRGWQRLPVHIEHLYVVCRLIKASEEAVTEDHPWVLVTFCVEVPEGAQQVQHCLIPSTMLAVPPGAHVYLPGTNCHSNWPRAERKRWVPAPWTISMISNKVPSQQSSERKSMQCFECAI